MTRLLIICVLPLLMTSMLLMSLTGCENGYDSFDTSAEGIVDVVTNILSSYANQAPDGADVATAYYTLADDLRAMPADPFEPDAVVYTVPTGCIESYIDREQNKVLNRLIRMELLDEQGVSVPVNSEIEGLFHGLAELEHDMLSITVFKTGGEYFACVELNVNWHSPYDLYYYDRVENRLVPLYRWEGEAVVGLRLRNPELLKNLNS